MPAVVATDFKLYSRSLRSTTRKTRNILTNPSPSRDQAATELAFDALHTWQGNLSGLLPNIQLPRYSEAIFDKCELFAESVRI